MRFHLNLGFANGEPLSATQLANTAPVCGELKVEAAAGYGVKPSRFRRVAVFSVKRNPQLPQILFLYEPVLSRAGEGYMELIGFEKERNAYRIQSWILRLIVEEVAWEHPLETKDTQDTGQGPSFNGSMAHLQWGPRRNAD